MVFGKQSLQGYESNRRHAEGFRVEKFHWNHSVWSLGGIQDFMEDVQCELEHFKDRILFMSMYNDIALGEKRKTEKCFQNSFQVAKCARRFLCRRWSFLGLVADKKWYGTYFDKPDGNWDRTAEMIILQIQNPFTIYYSCTQCL